MCSDEHPIGIVDRVDVFDLDQLRWAVVFEDVGMVDFRDDALRRIAGPCRGHRVFERTLERVDEADYRWAAEEGGHLSADGSSESGDGSTGDSK